MLQPVKIFCCIAVMATGTISHTCAQEKNLPNSCFVRPISAVDSVQVQRYVDSINTSGLFSRRRQRYYDSALTIKPWKAGWWQQKGMPLMKQGRYEAGMRYLDSAVKYDMRRYIDYRAFMKCIFQKSYRAAIKDFELAKEVIGAGEVMDHTYDFYTGLCYLQLEQLDSAAFFLSMTINEQLKSRGEKYVHYLDVFYLGVVYHEQEDYNKALGLFDRCLAQYGNFSDAEYYRADCLYKLGKPREALTVMMHAHEHFLQGYTINEDNVVHEFYPYQVHKPRYYDGALEELRSAVAAVDAPVK